MLNHFTNFAGSVQKRDLNILPPTYGTLIGSSHPPPALQNASKAINGTFYSGLNGVNLNLDRQLTNVLSIAILVMVLTVLTLRGCQLFSSHLRHIYCLTASRAQQNYWSFDRTIVWPWLKKNLMYAPLGKKRHNREIQLSKALNYGTIPSRIHASLLFIYFASNVIFCALLDYNQSKPHVLAELRGRSGMLAVWNMMPLMMMAARNNPAIPLLKISFDTFNLFHRWLGRLVVFESAVHVLAWYGAIHIAKGAKGASKAFDGEPFLQYGLIGMLAMAVITIQALSPIRHAFYEVFLNLHQFLAFFGILGVYLHLDLPKLPALPYARVTVWIWIGERLLRVIRIVYLNFRLRRGNTSVVVEALPGQACKLTFQLPRHVTIRPGSHVYAYLPWISLWQSHPFSVAWTNVESEPPTGRLEGPRTPASLEKQTLAPAFQARQAPTSLSLIVAARTGMTRKMYHRALSSESGYLRMTGFIEGPYAGHDSLASYGTVIMFAAGAGITHHLVQIRHLVACSHAKTVATRKIVLVWTVRDVDAFAWVRSWMDEILDMPGRREILKILLYVTRSKEADYQSPGNTITSYAGRCDPGAVLDQELVDRIGATMVSVCGPGAFADEVRAATRTRMGMACMDLNEESFTW